jgi:hypothetical protein
MIEHVETGLQWSLGIAVFLSFILLAYCIITKKEINSWQFPVLLAVFLDSIFVFSILRKTNATRYTISEHDSQIGRSPHQHR